MTDGAENPNELSHYGVLGMKWGHRKTATTAEIKAARRRVRKIQNENQKAHRARARTEKGSAERREADAKIAKITDEFRRTPDRIIATRMTRGEKAVATLLSGPLVVIPIAITSGISRRIEQKHDKGKYVKK